MTPPEAVSKLHDAAVLWSVGYNGGAEVVRAACDALVAGVDGPSLRILAGVSMRHPDGGLRDTLPETCTELGLLYHPENSLGGEVAALNVLASRVLTGSLAPRELTAWVHRRFDHDDRVAFASPLSDIDDEYDALGDGPVDPAALDARVLEEARQIVDASCPPAAFPVS